MNEVLECAAEQGLTPIIIEDINESLIRNNNRRDKAIQEFIYSHSLSIVHNLKCTYHGHNGNSSQIDYAFSTSTDVLNSYTILDPVNTSTHTPVKITLTLNSPLPIQTVKKLLKRSPVNGGC